MADDSWTDVVLVALAGLTTIASGFAWIIKRQESRLKDEIKKEQRRVTEEKDGHEKTRNELQDSLRRAIEISNEATLKLTEFK